MANVADTKLYDILGVSPSASENELKKVSFVDWKVKGIEVGTKCKQRKNGHRGNVA